MALRIQNNIAAMNAQRQLNISNAGLTKSLERLSSGYRINRAADDAAGLAISQSFRAEIASFKVASRNVSEANSLLQVAEGAMDQLGNILTRLKELATQAASGNAGANIDKINAEANELVLEFERIVTSTEYAGTTLLTGEIGGVTGMSIDTETELAIANLAGSSITGVTVDHTATAAAAGTYTVNAAASDTNVDWTITGPGGSMAMTVAQDATSVAFEALGITLSLGGSVAATIASEITDFEITIVEERANDMVFQIGAKNEADNRLSISLEDARIAQMGLAQDMLSTAESAQTALTTIDDAISTLTEQRGNIGAYMNRLEYASANLDTTIENVQAAESVIRDVDMAAEMTEFVKYQILMQAGTAMLAQANMAPQSVLGLLG